MGMFDSVYVPCPDCKTLTEFQSKAGECDLSSYNLGNVPGVILSDLINRPTGEKCPACGRYFQVPRDSMFKLEVTRAELDMICLGLDRLKYEYPKVVALQERLDENFVTPEHEYPDPEKNE